MYDSKGSNKQCQRQGHNSHGDDDERELYQVVTSVSVLGYGSGSMVRVGLSASLAVQNTTGVPARMVTSMMPGRLLSWWCRETAA